MEKVNRERKLVDERFDCDTDRLYGPLDDAIKYLMEVRDKYPGTNITLFEQWSGYEDMTMVFDYSRLENDEEYNHRIELEEASVARQQAIEKQKYDEERVRDMAAFQKLKSKLGL